MRKAFCCLAVFVVACLPLVGKDQRPATPEKRADTPDEALLKRAGLQLTEDKLIAYLQQRTGEDSDLLRIKQLVRQLGAETFEEREEASRKLVLLGKSALTELRRAQNDADPEIARRSSLCLQALGKDRNEILAVIRLLSQTASPDTTRGLLRFLPYALDEQMEEEIWFALDAVACKQRLVDAVPTVLLIDPLPVRRAAAGYLLARRGGAKERKTAQKLLVDPDARVRLRVAQGLLGARDASGVPALIGLLDQPSVTLGWQAEELLHWAAGDNAPDELINAGSQEDRAHCRVAWEKWWHKNGSSLDLAKPDLATRCPGLILAIPNSIQSNERPMICGWDGQPRWLWLRQSAVVDLHLVEDNRFLAIEEWPGSSEKGNCGDEQKKRKVRLLECSLEGKNLRMFDVASEPVTCQCLWNGNTLVFNYGPSLEIIRQDIEEISPEGNRVLLRNLRGDIRKNPPHTQPEFPYILSNGRLCYGNQVSEQNVVNNLMEVDPVSGLIFKKIACDTAIASGAITEPLVNGHYLIAPTRNRGAIEINEQGATVWKYTAVEGKIKNGYPISAVRLRNGNTLISTNLGIGTQVIEVDALGKVIWRIPTPGCSRISICLGLVRLGFDFAPPADLDLDQSVPWLIKGLTRKNSDIRKLSLSQLGNLGENASLAIPALIDALNDPVIHTNVVQLLETLLGKNDLPVVLKATKDNRAKVRAGAIELLGKYHKEGKIVVPVLLSAYRDTNTCVRNAAAGTSMHYRDYSKALVPELLKCLNDKDLYYNAMQSLSNFGADAQAAIPPLLEIAKKGGRDKSFWALSALQQLANEDSSIAAPVVTVLFDILNDRSRADQRVDAAGFLVLLGPKVDETASKLQKLIDFELVELERIATNETSVIPTLDVECVLIRLFQTLTKMGPKAIDTIPSVRKALNTHSPAVRDAARTTIKLLQR